MPKTMSLLLSVVFASVTIGTAQAAGSISVSLPDSGSFAAQLGKSQKQLEDEVASQLSNVFQQARVGDYLRSLADAQAFTTRGTGADYASNFKAVMVGAAGNVAFNVDKGVGQQNDEKPPVAGVSTNVTLMAGLNLGLIGLDGLTIYGNYFQWKGHFDQFDTDIRNWGTHLQLKLFGPGEEKLLNALIRWGGFDITTGIEYARLKLSLSDRWQRNIGITGGTGAGDPYVAVNASGVLSIDMNTMSVPIELTTNLRLLYLLALYGGVGIDWQVGGQSDMVIDVRDEELRGHIPNQSDVRLGRAVVTANETAHPSAGRVRFLAGVQLNFLFVKLFTQLNVITSSPAIASVAFGARIAF